MNFFLERTDLRQGGRLPLSGGAVSIGRSPANTIALSAEDRGVSAYHAVIYADPQRMLLQDLQSTNGTFVNGRQVQECALGIGDEIGLGRSGPKFRVVGDGINNINRIGGINGINYGINNINTSDPGSSLDAGLTGIAEPQPRRSDGGKEGKERPSPLKHPVVAAMTGLATILTAITQFILIPHQCQNKEQTASTPAVTGKEFFSAPPLPAPATPISTQAPISMPKSISTTDDKINAVLSRFGEDDGYRAPPEMTERVEHYLTLYQGPMRGTITLWMERSRRYFPMIRTIFSEKNVPLELAYVSMLESGFNPQALSHAGAAGMWQFMPHTARRYGLRVENGTDERTDPEKATRAAAAYFKDLIAIFGSRSSVLLCMAAYNAGEQRVINALKRIDDPVRDRDFWHLYKMGWLAKETNEYIPQVIALIIISDNMEEYGF
jgi:pSer/pThr/pTyr-binding forkhead associated (FHA) protein